MIRTRSVARELALLVLGQISDKENLELNLDSPEALLYRAIESLMQFWRENLDESAILLDNANQQLLESELQESHGSNYILIREPLKKCIQDIQSTLNNISESLELPHLLALSDENEIKEDSIKRARLVLEKKITIDERLDSVMEGWRLKRLPKIDRDILRLAVVDLFDLNTPASVSCSEAVALANRYSDEQGRRMINGVLRRLQNSFPSKKI